MSRITTLDAFPVREPVSRRSYTILRLATDSGLTGYGECRAIRPVDLEQARRLLSGKDPTAYEVIRRDIASVAALAGGVNMALLDLVGKQAKAPAYHVLGGPTRNKVRALASVATDAHATAARDAGFRAVAVGVSANALRRFEALRKAAPDLDFVLDAAGRLTPTDAAKLASAFERFHLLWLDEPCAVSSVSALRKLAEESVTPLGLGRSVRAAAEFQDLLREQVIDVLRPDIALHGITSIRRMAAIAETYYTAVAPYHAGGPVATAAALQLAASLPNFFIQQIPFPEAAEDRSMRAELIAEPVEAVKDGYAALPAGAGLGITINEKALEKYQ
jgi:galactonate dehydratase